ncbi:MAG: hypothetical protein OXG39_01050 [Chloroflexi bacterium]|nr:hypothetical protein [Chloroflexota bacterium]
MNLSQEAKNLIAMTALVGAVALALNNVALDGNDRNLLSWSVGLFFVSVFFWLWMRRDALAEQREEAVKAAEESASRAEELAKRTQEKSQMARQPDPAGATVDAIEADDLTKIYGIGNIFREILYDAGIKTFDQLSNSSREGLIGVIVAAGKVPPPGLETWPQQAVYAAKGDWDGLRAYVNAS